ncbi:AGE family epimerase/isomerase [Sphingomonas sp. ASY06-1R]|uniref:AGE family epimerase/isomerase n=1 Tax=Sphingomonas sp. ASY06-1R TaxID=3445771 RepID=UPI003FA22F40
MLNNYIDWIQNAALPAWAERGFDSAAGRFQERLDQSGTPMIVPHRAMVQARQIFVFAHAAEQGWSDRGQDLAERAMHSLIRDFASDHDGETSFAFSIDPIGGTVVSATRDAYAHAFVLFSIAALYRLNQDPQLLALADRTIRFVESQLDDKQYGGLFDALPAPDEKRQNPHMHLLEAYLFLEQAAPGRGYLERAATLVALFEQRFFIDGRLLEYFARDWTVAQRAAWEPGHHFEWVWLLGEYATLSGADLGGAGAALYAAAQDHGIAENGLVVDEIAAAGDTLLKGSHRVWPHTEAIKAAATRHASGDAKAHAFADQMAAGLMNTFLDRPFSGGWIDHVSAATEPLVDYVPASSLYHIVLAGSVAAKGFAATP